MTLSEYLIEQGLEREILVIEDVKNFIYELRKLGNNINQITHLANSGAIKVVYLDGFKEDLRKILKALNSIVL
jgi:CheY-like chemotaxis protein